MESVRDMYLTDDVAETAFLLNKSIAGCASDDVDEIRSLGATLGSWRSNVWPTTTPARPRAHRRPQSLCHACEAVRPRVQGFEHYRLRVLLHAGGDTLAIPAEAAAHPKTFSPIKRVGRDTVRTPHLKA